MTSFVASINLAAAPASIWPEIADVMKWPEWLPTMTSVESLSSSALAIGNQYKVVQPGFRPTLWTVVEYEPLRTFAWEARWIGARAIATHSINSISGTSSEVVLKVNFSGPLSLIASTLAGRRIEKYLALEVNSLKQKIENQS
jgi:hypothetical protein